MIQLRQLVVSVTFTNSNVDDLEQCLQWINNQVGFFLFICISQFSLSTFRIDLKI